MEAHKEKIRENVAKIKESMKNDLRQEFGKLDRDGDGSLTKDEFKHFIKSAKQKWQGFHDAFFEGLDTNKDHKVSFEGKFRRGKQRELELSESSKISKSSDNRCFPIFFRVVSKNSRSIRFGIKRSTQFFLGQ